MRNTYRFFTYGEKKSEELITSLSGKGLTPHEICTKYQKRFNMATRYEKGSANGANIPNMWTEAMCEEPVQDTRTS